MHKPKSRGKNSQFAKSDDDSHSDVEIMEQQPLSSTALAAILQKVVAQAVKPLEDKVVSHTQWRKAFLMTNVPTAAHGAVK